MMGRFKIILSVVFVVVALSLPEKALASENKASSSETKKTAKQSRNTASKAAETKKVPIVPIRHRGLLEDR